MVSIRASRGPLLPKPVSFFCCFLQQTGSSTYFWMQELLFFVHFKLFTIFLHEIVLSVEIKRGSLGWMNLCQTWIRYLYLQWIEYLPRSLNSCFMKRPLKFDEISKFYLKLFSSVKKSLEISSYFCGLLKRKKKVAWTFQ